MAEKLRTVDNCGICLEPFGSDHAPTHFSDSDSCRHIFGKECVREWLLSSNVNANKCPTCRHVIYIPENPISASNGGELSVDEWTIDNGGTNRWDTDDWGLNERGNQDDWGNQNGWGNHVVTSQWEVDDGQEEEDDASMEADSGTIIHSCLQDMTDPEVAYLFMSHLIDELSGVPEIWDSEIVVRVIFTCIHFDLSGVGLYDSLHDFLYSNDRMMEVLRSLYAELMVGSIDEPRLRNHWIPEFGAAVGWQLDSTEETDIQDWPSRFRDITNRTQAVVFMRHIGGALRGATFFSDLQLLACVEETCRHFGMQGDLQLTRRCRDMLLSILHNLFRDLENENTHIEDSWDYWIQRMSAAVGWHIEPDE